jgi:hypothetical protein
MVMLASDGPAVEPPVRHGTCRLTLTIGGTHYRLRPVPGQPRGMRVYALRSMNGEREGKVYAVAVVNREAGCTCPDAEVNGATCKHVMALRAIGFLPISARTASETKAEAARLAATKRRRAAAPPAPPAIVEPTGPDPLARARRRHSPVVTSPAPPASPSVTGFRSAIGQHVAQLQKGGVN